MTPVFWLSDSLTQPHGRTAAMPWGDFGDRVHAARPADAKESLARWAPVEFYGDYRKLANVRRAFACVIDVDDGSPLESIVGALADLHVIVHSTWSATPDAPRWRVVIPLDEPATAEEYARAWRFFAMRLERTGVRPDYAARDASRAWAVPARPPSGFYVARVVEGAFASKAEALSVIPKPEPLPAYAPSVDNAGGYDRRLERAERYLGEMDGAISGAGGHRTTFKAATAMVRGFALQPNDALHLLLRVHNPLCQPEWTERELAHKVRQALQRSRLPFSYIADKPRRST
jgi:hypothetical protein